MNRVPFLAILGGDSDRHLLIIAIVFLVVIFLLLGLLGMAIRATTSAMGKKMDDELHDAVIHRVIDNPKQLLRYGRIKNGRVFFKSALPALAVLLVSIILYVSYAGATGNWHEDFLGHFSTLFWTWDWDDPSCWSNFWGLTLLSGWPPLESSPHWVNEYWASYILVPLWTASIVLFALSVQAWIARLLLLHRRVHSVYGKSLEGFNFYDEEKAASLGKAADPADEGKNPS